jgi:hypothetical protein
VSSLPAARLPDESLALRAQADAAIEAARALLDHPAFAQNLGVAVLSRMALDEKVPAKERRRCAEVLAQLQLRTIEALAARTGAREQRLKDLGIEAPPQEVNLTQVNQRIEIVREGAKDWRTPETA